MAWFLNRALTNWRAAINARWPNRDKTHDGTIGDDAHKETDSDHNEDADGSVDAFDMGVKGVDVELCKMVFQAHESARYWIHNDQIAHRARGWRRESYAYAGPNRNRHTEHVHWNSEQTKENSNAPWIFPEVGMALDENSTSYQADIWRMDALMSGSDTVTGGPRKGETMWVVGAIKAIDRGITEVRESLASTPVVTIDYDRLADAVVRALLEQAR